MQTSFPQQQKAPPFTPIQLHVSALLVNQDLAGRKYQQAAADILHQRSVRRDVDFGLNGIASTKSLKALDFKSMALLTGLQAGAR
ncbi:MAG TPA: hypothetical protein PLN25_11870 [Deltaproteobacteria bacterium]|jgi:hypothetical protein|nr:hypothetical protein [Deltaproteobacteria bacterium]HQA98398.1 hypothetical protein [Clostridia bacterium]HUM60684.1 hypothetical protein [Clostridia bacterium]